MSAAKNVYRFGGGLSEGGADMCDLLGNKGANLAEMAAMGLSVPPGIIITTTACRETLNNGGDLAPSLVKEIEDGLSWLEEVSGRGFGDPDKPLLLSARSGGAQSMPGMLDTILNLGLDDAITNTLVNKTANKVFVLDCYRRLIEMYGAVVMGVDEHIFDDLLLAFEDEHGLRSEQEIDEAGWRTIIKAYKRAIERKLSIPYPQDIHEQLTASIAAVFRSWQAPRAVSYRTMQGLDDAGGTAVTLQMMVFGNRSENSASGIVFTRNPSNGVAGLYGEYLPMTQGEDVVAGFRSPRALTKKGRLKRDEEALSFEEWKPAAYGELQQMAARLEQRFKNMQEVEFTLDEDRLWLLQTRNGKRTIEAAIRIAVDFLDEGLIAREQLTDYVSLAEFRSMAHPVIDPAFKGEAVATGLPASPGAASGQLAFTSKDAVALAEQGLPAVLVRNETSPSDVYGMNAAAAMLTRRGGMTSHAAVIARAMGRPCIVDARMITLDMEAETMRVGEQAFAKGAFVTIDGTMGRVYAGEAPLVAPELDEYARRLQDLLDKTA